MVANHSGVGGEKGGVSGHDNDGQKISLQLRQRDLMALRDGDERCEDEGDVAWSGGEDSVKSR